MGVCYMLSESFCETRKQRATRGEEILERKTYRGTKHVRQVKVGQWRVASLYLRGIDVAEVVQLCYICNKNQNAEPDQDVLVAIDKTAEQLFAEVADMSLGDQSEYISTMQTKFPDI